MKHTLQIQFFGTGKSKAGGGGGGAYSRTPEQDKTLRKLDKQTANLKNEQYRIVDSEGNVILEKKGGRGEVSTTIGEKRTYLNGNISIHNHPDGGTFSDADLGQFGFGAKEIVVAAPEGTYRLINLNYGKKTMYDGWMPLRDGMESIQQRSTLDILRQARQNVSKTATAKAMDKITDTFAKIRDTKGQEEANKYIRSVSDRYESLRKKHNAEVKAEQSKLELEPYHNYYKQNAKKYGFQYVFEKRGS